MNIQDEINAELARATAKFPDWPRDPLHALAVLQEEVGELQKEVLQAVYEPHKTSVKHIRAEAIQVAAMAQMFIEGLGGYDYERSEMFKTGANRWIQHEPGDPMPKRITGRIDVVFADGSVCVSQDIGTTCSPFNFWTGKCHPFNQITHWRPAR